MRLDDSFELITLEESLKEIQLPDQVKEIRNRVRPIPYDIWAREKGLPDKDLIGEGQHDEEDNLDKEIEEIRPIFIIKPKEEYYNKGVILVGFDESTYSISGTYAKLIAMKFGECHQTPKGKRWGIKTYSYRPMLVYLEDTSQKMEIYKRVIRKFVDVLYTAFELTTLKPDVFRLIEWFEEVFEPDMNFRMENRQYKIPTLAHVVDRIRTADELVRSILRMKDLIENTNQTYMFLGDGISAFRSHIFPPPIFNDFFLKFIQTYDICYYTYSKTCRLRDRQGRFFLPIYREMFPEKAIFIPIPQFYSKSLTYLVRLQQKQEILRFDVPEYKTEEGALEIHTNLMPFAPLGYPLALEEAHNATQLLAPEKTNFNAKFQEIKLDPKTKHFIEEMRSKILPP